MRQRGLGRRDRLSAVREKKGDLLMLERPELGFAESRDQARDQGLRGGRFQAGGRLRDFLVDVELVAHLKPERAQAIFCRGLSQTRPRPGISKATAGRNSTCEYTSGTAVRFTRRVPPG